MLSPFDAYSTLEDNISTFNSWILYLNDELKSHTSKQKDRIGVFSAVFDRETDKMVWDCIKDMERYTDKTTSRLRKGDSIQCNIRNIDVLFRKLNEHQKQFTFENVRANFTKSNTSWNEKEFSLLKESSDAAITILQNAFQKYLPDYLSKLQNLLSPENRNNLLKYSKTYFIKNIVTSILLNENTAMVLEESKGNYGKHKDSVNPTKIKESPTYSFMIDYMFLDKMTPVQREERKERVNDIFLNMLISLQTKEFIGKATKAELKAIIGYDKVKNKIDWIGTNGSLHYFIKRIHPMLNTNKENKYSPWVSAANCFLFKNKTAIDYKKLNRDYGEKDYKASKLEIDLSTKEFYNYKQKFPLKQV